MRIAYGKTGRSWKLDPRNGTTTGGDADVARALHNLARSRPEDTFVLVSRNSGENPQAVGYPENVINPWEDKPGGLMDQLREKTKALRSAESERSYTEEGLKQLMDWYASTLTPATFGDVDEVIMWVGQHGSTNIPLPGTADRSVMTYPQDTFITYAAYLFIGINDWQAKNPGKDVIWLCPDPRNYLKCRDLKEPLKFPVIAQYSIKKALKHERYDDPTEPPAGITWDKQGGVWVASQSYSYEALELTALPSPAAVSVNSDHQSRSPFGLLINENRGGGRNPRVNVLKRWVMPFWPQADIFGKWTDESKKELGREDIDLCSYGDIGPTLQKWRCTLTTPASSSGWATAKPWECFAYGVVCFFHPEYDTQDNILKDAPDTLKQWLRVKSPEELKARVDYLNENPDVWQQLIHAQRAYYESKYTSERGGVRAIMNRLDGVQ